MHEFTVAREAFLAEAGRFRDGRSSLAALNGRFHALKRAARSSTDTDPVIVQVLADATNLMRDLRRARLAPEEANYRQWTFMLLEIIDQTVHDMWHAILRDDFAGFEAANRERLDLTSAVRYYLGLEDETLSAECKDEIDRILQKVDGVVQELMLKKHLMREGRKKRPFAPTLIALIVLATVCYGLALMQEML